MNLNFYIPHQLTGVASMIWEQRSDVSQHWKILPNGCIELIFNLGEKVKGQDIREDVFKLNKSEDPCLISQNSLSDIAYLSKLKRTITT